LELTLDIPEGRQRLALFGAADRNLRLIRDLLGVQIQAREGKIKLTGPRAAVARAVDVIERLQDALEHKPHLAADDIHEAIAESSEKARAEAEDPNRIDVYARGKGISPRSEGQAEYVQAIRTHDLVFCAGPAGTGKTYLAVALAVASLKRQQSRRIILARPAVEAGEKLGFLPGDLAAKVNPYLRPLLDALADMMDFDQLKRFMVNDMIEVAPLAYMRGRTLNEATVILDEAQNTTPSQMLMFLTRLGNESKMIVTGDVSQVDLEPGQQSGMIDAMYRLRGVKGIAMIELSRRDIVRHELVQRIVDVYARPDKPQGGERRE
jgi:phosphate starvation-inducible PhoH-like protein